MPLLFSCGTLQQEVIQRSTFGRLLHGPADALPGYERPLVAIDDSEVLRTSGKARHPIARLTGAPDAQIPGMVFEIADAEPAHADRYEVAAYKRAAARPRSGKEAWAYVDASKLPP